ncbi:alpha/beta fold hydrolase [Erythrobacter sp. Alg231-14]|uniref:alpha/beta fold hydrolase n=1 Tax=Erythrobacter sp. Alg231-14 TaxID=1922225 RepID=UPI000D553281
MKFAIGVALFLAWVGAPVSAQNMQATQVSEPSVTRLADLDLAVEGERPAAIPTEHFANRSAYRRFSVSPDGAHIAIKRVVDGETALLLIDAASQQPLKVYKLGEDQRLDWFRWAGNEKLITSISALGDYYGLPVRKNRLFVRNIANNATWMLEVDDDLLNGGDLVHVAEDGAFALIAVQRNQRSQLSVYRYDLLPGAERVRVVDAQRAISNWYADTSGTVRLGIAWRNGRQRIYYRSADGDDFELADVWEPGDDDTRYWNVIQINEDSDQGYVLEENSDGRVGVRLFDYSTGDVVETFYEHPQWDIDRLWLDRDGSPFAAFFTDDREQIHWFNEEMGALYQELKNALDMEQLIIVSRSRNNERILVWGGSEADPGALYVFSTEDLTLDLLGDYRPELDFEQLVRPVPVRYQARDGLLISAYLTVPRGVEPRDLPLIVMPHGGPFGVRDELTYNDEVQLLANRGYAVLQPNFRGSGGYGKAFYDAGRGQVGRGMQDDIDDAMDWAVDVGIADANRVCVVGGSYGGFAALWAVLRNPERYRCAASWAGVTNWDRMLSYDRRYLGREAALDLREREEGDVDDLDDFSPVNHASSLNRPVLLAHGSEDRRVPVSQYRMFRDATTASPVPPRTLLIDGEGHSFSEQENEQKWYDTLLEFLAEHNPSDLPPASSGGGK